MSEVGGSICLRMEKFFQMADLLWQILFRAHDLLADMLIRFGSSLKRLILILAHLSVVIGIMVPSFRRGFGEAAGALLIFLLFLSPLSKIFRMRLLLLLMGFRREIGILMGYFACIHGIGYIFQGYDMRTAASLSGSVVGFALFSGFFAMVLLVPLILTSNRMSGRILGAWWKRLHALVYPAFIFVVLHRALIGAGREGVSMVVRGLEAALLLGSYGILKLLAWRDFSPFLRQISERVARSYESYHEKRSSVERKRI